MKKVEKYQTMSIFLRKISLTDNEKWEPLKSKFQALISNLS